MAAATSASMDITPVFVGAMATSMDIQKKLLRGVCMHCMCSDWSAKLCELCPVNKML